MEKENSDFAPDFFVVGAPKAGTTALFHWLNDHPDVFLPVVKEPAYFTYSGKPATPKNGPYDPDYVRQIAQDSGAYAALYDAAGSRLTGDISPIYLIDENAAERIAAVRPDARIIVLLRDPVDRAFSQFLHHVRDSLETCETFDDALDMEAQRLRDGWSWGHGYATHGHYAAQIERYLLCFPREQILFLEFQELQLEPEVCWRRICSHLALEHKSLVRNERVNATAGLTQVPRRPGISRHLRHSGTLQTRLKRFVPKSSRAWLRKLLEGRGRPVPVLSTETKRSLAGRYRDERTKIEEQTGLSLNHWSV